MLATRRSRAAASRTSRTIVPGWPLERASSILSGLSAMPRTRLFGSNAACSISV